MLTLAAGWRGALLRASLIMVAGSALPLAFAPLHAWWFAPWPLAVLFALAGERPGVAAGHGYLFGLGLFGVGVGWVHVGLAVFGLGPVAVVLATGALVAGLALFPAAALALARVLRPRRDAGFFLLAAPAAWVALEWLRGWLFTGFPWLTLGTSQTAGPFGTQLAPIFGALGLSLLVAVVAGVLAWIGITRRRYLARGLAFAGVLALAPLTGALPLTEWTHPAGTPIRAVLVQGNFNQSGKWRAANLQPELARYRRLSAPFWGRTDLIVWPETAVPELYRRLAPTFFRRLAQRVHNSGTRLIVGVPRFQNGRLYDSALDVGQGLFYDKRHLVPFGEYLPLRGVLGPVFRALGLPEPAFDAGAGNTRMPVAGYKAGLAICYEIAFSRQIAATAAHAAFLINLSDDAWFGNSIGPSQNLQIAQMRAMETGRPVLRATDDGITAVIDAHGAITTHAPRFKAVALRTRVVPRNGLTPYLRWTDRPVVVLMLIVLGALLGQRLSFTRCTSAHSAS